MARERVPSDAGDLVTGYEQFVEFYGQSLANDGTNVSRLILSEAAVDLDGDIAALSGGYPHTPFHARAWRFVSVFGTRFYNREKIAQAWQILEQDKYDLGDKRSDWMAAYNAVRSGSDDREKAMKQARTYQKDLRAGKFANEPVLRTETRSSAEYGIPIDVRMRGSKTPVVLMPIKHTHRANIMQYLDGAIPGGRVTISDPSGDLGDLSLSVAISGNHPIVGSLPHGYLIEAYNLLALRVVQGNHGRLVPSGSATFDELLRDVVSEVRRIDDGKFSISQNDLTRIMLLEAERGGHASAEVQHRHGACCL